jgi:Kdo2-lipid IVA lauroyltransferase/acyltransferase
MFAIKLFSRLPFRVLYAFSDFLFFVSYHVIKYRRKLVWKNLKNSFPSKSEAELRKIEKQFYTNLCDYGVEMIKLLTISEEELRRRVRFINPELCIKHIENGQSVLSLASHQFNWEWLLVAGSIILPGEMDFVYQPVNSKFFDRFSYICRTRFGAHGIKRDTVAREVLKRKHIVRNISIVGDQYPGWGHDKRYAATFLHQPTVFFNGPNQLALLTQYPVTYYAMRKVKRGFYETKIVELAFPPYDKNSFNVIQDYIQEIEKVIHNDPAGWLWSHNRWKTRHLEQNPTN